MTIYNQTEQKWKDNSYGRTMEGQLLRRVLPQDQCIQQLLKRAPSSIVGVYTLEELNTTMPASLDTAIPIAIIINTEGGPYQARRRTLGSHLF